MYSFFILNVYDYCNSLLSFCLYLYTYIFDLFYISWPFMVPAVDHMNMNKSISISVGLFVSPLPFISFMILRMCYNVPIKPHDLVVTTDMTLIHISS